MSPLRRRCILMRLIKIPAPIPLLPPPAGLSLKARMSGSSARISGGLSFRCARHCYGMSIENREIPAIKISDNPNRNEESEASVLIVGGTHAREWIAVNVPLLIAEYLLANSMRDDIKALIDHADIWDCAAD